MKFVILGTLPGLNEYISAERSNRHSAAKMKKQTEYAIGMIARSQHRKAHFKRPVVMRYLWVEKDRRRDLDNVAFAKNSYRTPSSTRAFWKATAKGILWDLRIVFPLILKIPE